jgi:hypothetical protein
MRQSEEAHRERARVRARERRQERAAMDVPDHVPHGSISTYTNWMCRCVRCSNKWSKYLKKFRAARKAAGV